MRRPNFRYMARAHQVSEVQSTSILPLGVRHHTSCGDFFGVCSLVDSPRFKDTRPALSRFLVEAKARPVINLSQGKCSSVHSTLIMLGFRLARVVATQPGFGSCVVIDILVYAVPQQDSRRV